MSKITNKDIAAMAGVSPAAVSLAIHGKRGVSDETRARILEAVRETNYAPPTRTILQPDADAVILTPGPDGSVPPDLLDCLLDYAADNGAELRVCTRRQLMENYPARLAGCRLLVVLDELERMTLDLLSSVLPRILMIDGDRSRKPFCNIRADYAGAAYGLMEYLTGLRHRNFIYLNRDLPAGKNLLAFSGFQQRILELRLPLDPAQIVMDAASGAHIWSHLPDIVRQRNISAVFCTSDAAAVETVNRLTAAGLRVPEDVSVATITGGGEAAHPGFSFTRVSLNIGRLAEEARRRLNEPPAESDPRDVVIPAAKVAVGSSTAAPKFDPTTKKLAIALILKDHPTYRVVRAGFLNSVRHLGYQAEVVGVPDADEDSFRQACRTLPDLKPDGVVLWLPLPDVIEKFRDMGLPVVCPHSICRDGASWGIRANIAAPSERTAEHVADFFAAGLAGRQGVVAVSQTSEAEQETALTRNFIRRMAELCPNVTVRSDLLFVNHTEENTRLVMDYIRNTPDLLGAYTTAGEACVTWAAAKKAVGRDDMIIVGTDYTDETLDLVEAGEVQAFVAQPLYEEAQSSAVALDKILRGNDLPYFTALDAPLVTKEAMEPYRRLLREVHNWYA